MANTNIQCDETITNKELEKVLSALAGEPTVTSSDLANRVEKILRSHTKKKFWVTYKIDGRFVAEVEATSVEEALQEAEAEYMDTDFGKLADISGTAIIVEDENDNYVWEK